jgi:hypothetical protein
MRAGLVDLSLSRRGKRLMLIGLRAIRDTLTEVNGMSRGRRHACCVDANRSRGLAAERLKDAAQDHVVEAAFVQVLGAEQAAREAIAQAHARAASIAEASRADVRARSERTRRHIGALRAAFERRMQSELAQLSEQAQALQTDAPLTDADRACVQRAVAQLASELTCEPAPARAEEAA